MLHFRMEIVLGTASEIMKFTLFSLICMIIPDVKLLGMNSGLLP
jgi:hypothetical protein